MKLNTNEVMERLRDRYKGKDGIFYCEEFTDSSSRRRADALILNLWQSANYAVEGFEVKVSKADLDHEIDDYNKWEALGKYCDKWWLVLGDKDLIDTDRIPKTWGIMYPTKTRLKVFRQAPKLPAIPITKQFVVSLMYKLIFDREARKAKYKIEDDIKKARSEGFNEGKLSGSVQESRRYNTLVAKLERFEKESGIDIDNYRYGNIGKDVKAWIDANRTQDEFVKYLENNIRRVDNYSLTLKDIKATLQKGITND